MCGAELLAPGRRWVVYRAPSFSDVSGATYREMVLCEACFAPIEAVLRPRLRFNVKGEPLAIAEAR